MKILQQPDLIQLEEGEHLKTYFLKGLEGTKIPLHYASKEAVLIVQEGEAMLKLPDAQHLLIPGTTHIVPAGMRHSLQIYKDFKAFVIMAVDSHIEFEEMTANWLKAT